MLEILKFIFSDFGIWLGSFLMLIVLVAGLCYIVSSITEAFKR